MCRVPPRAEPARPASGRAGFTLLELLVAMFIAGLLATLVLQLIQGERRFVQGQSVRQEILQNARSAIELMARELRAAPPGAIRVAERNRIRFLLPRSWGILCQGIPVTGSGAVWVLFPRGTFPADFPASPEVATDWGLAVPAPGDAWSNSTLVEQSTGTPTCDARAIADADGWEARRLHYAALPAGAAAGDAVFIYQSVTYEAGPNPLGDPDQIWLKRNVGPGAPEPIAGPLGPDGSAGTDGLVFDYHCRNGRLATPPGDGGATGWPQLTAVQISVWMQSRELGAVTRQAELDSTMVRLRNAPASTDCVL